jgi:hypothetical protein
MTVRRRFSTSTWAKSQSGEIREERFGYVELAIEGYRSPCFDPEQGPSPAGSRPPPFISRKRWEGKTNVTFAVEMQFDFTSGQPTEWAAPENRQVRVTSECDQMSVWRLRPPDAGPRTPDSSVSSVAKNPSS